MSVQKPVRVAFVLTVSVSQISAFIPKRWGLTDLLSTLLLQTWFHYIICITFTLLQWRQITEVRPHMDKATRVERHHMEEVWTVVYWLLRLTKDLSALSPNGQCSTDKVHYGPNSFLWLICIFWNTLFDNRVNFVSSQKWFSKVNIRWDSSIKCNWTYRLHRGHRPLCNHFNQAIRISLLRIQAHCELCCVSVEDVSCFCKNNMNPI